MPQFKDFERTNALFPETVFLFLKLFLREKDPILDLNCGSGTTTRQLAKNGFQDIMAIDSNEAQINEARENPSSKQIGYIHIPAKKLPFKANFFKGITCFSSFEPYTENLLLYEIRRVLKKQGYLFVVTKQEKGFFSEELCQKVEEYLNQELPGTGLFTLSEELLKSYSLSKQPTRTFEGEDLHSQESYAEEFKQEPFFKLLPEKQKKELLEKVLYPYLESKMVWKRISIKYTAVCEVFKKS